MVLGAQEKAPIVFHRALKWGRPTGFESGPGGGLVYCHMDDPTTSNLDEADNTLTAVMAHGLAVFENEADFNHWLHSDNQALGGVQPQSLLLSGVGRAQVRGILYRIEWGMYS